MWSTVETMTAVVVHIYIIFIRFITGETAGRAGPIQPYNSTAATVSRRTQQQSVLLISALHPATRTCSKDRSLEPGVALVDRLEPWRGAAGDKLGLLSY